MTTALYSPVQTEHEVIMFGNLEIHLTTYRVRVDGHFVPLGYLEFELLRLLALQADHIVPLGMVMEKLWENPEEHALGNLRVLVHRLKTKLAASRPYQIDSVKRRGYGLLRS